MDSLDYMDAMDATDANAQRTASGVSVSGDTDCGVGCGGSVQPPVQPVQPLPPVPPVPSAPRVQVQNANLYIMSQHALAHFGSLSPRFRWAYVHSSLTLTHLFIPWSLIHIFIALLTFVFENLLANITNSEYLNVASKQIIIPKTTDNTGNFSKNAIS